MSGETPRVEGASSVDSNATEVDPDKSETESCQTISLHPDDAEVRCPDCDRIVRSELDVFGPRIHVVCRICNANSHVIFGEDNTVIERVEGELKVRAVGNDSESEPKSESGV